MQIEARTPGFVEAGRVFWLSLVRLRSSLPLILCIFFVALLLGMLGWGSYVMVVYMLVTGEYLHVFVLSWSGGCGPYR